MGDASATSIGLEVPVVYFKGANNILANLGGVFLFKLSAIFAWKEENVTFSVRYLVLLHNHAASWDKHDVGVHPLVDDSFAISVLLNLGVIDLLTISSGHL